MAEQSQQPQQPPVAEQETTFSDPLGAVGEEEESLVNIVVGPRIISNGLQLRVKGHEQPFLTFDYALSPLTENSAPVDWKILVTEDVQSQNIRCHDLQAGDKLPSLVTQYQQAYAMAVILLNSEESYSLDPAFLEGGERGSYPVLVLRHSDGTRLLGALDQYEGQDVLARVDVVESTVDTQSQLSLGGSTTRAVKRINEQKDQGVGQRLLRGLFGGERRGSLNLKTEVKKLMFPKDGEPCIVSEDIALFRFVMATFYQYEKHVRPESGHGDVSDLLKRFLKYLPQVFPKDFPFYLLLFYRMHTKTSLYQCEELPIFMMACLDRMESLEPHYLASIFSAFLHRRDFTVMEGESSSASVFMLLEMACLELASVSHKIKLRTTNRQFYPRFILIRMMWVSLALKLHEQRGIITRSTADLWKTHLVNYQDKVILTEETLREVKAGLEFGRLVNLPPTLTLSIMQMADLFVSEKCVRSFHLARLYLQMVEPFIPAEGEFLTFLTQLRAVYDTWLRRKSTDKFNFVSVKGTLAGTLEEGLAFLNAVLEIWERRKFDPLLLDSECVKWLLLLLQLIDITASSPEIHLRKFLLGRTGVVKKHRTEITKCVIDMTRQHFSEMSIQQFFPLYRAFRIWPNKFLEDYLSGYDVPPGVKISDGTWRELFAEVVNRFTGAQHHRYLLNFLKSVAERYRDDGRAGELVLDLLKLGVPKLFVEGVAGGVAGEEPRASVPQEFSTFLWEFINRNAIKHTILQQTPQILEAISERDEFQQLVLAVVQKEVVPEFKTLQRGDSQANQSLWKVLRLTVDTLALKRDLSWLQGLNTKQRFCWGIVATCCSKVPISSKDFEWIHTYHHLTSNLGLIYQAYCEGKQLPMEARLLPDQLPLEIERSPSEDIRSYFDWVRRLQGVLVKWQVRFNEFKVNYDEILLYASHQTQLHQLGGIVCCSSAVVDSHLVQQVKNTFLQEFEMLNCYLIRYIPNQPESRWCTLPTLLDDYGVALPPNLLEPISKHILFPSEKKALVGQLLENPLAASSSGRFQPGHEISLQLSKAITLRSLCILVQDLQKFVDPHLEHIEVLVFFKLHYSEIFDKYLKLHLSKSKRAKASRSHAASLPFPGSSVSSAYLFQVPAFSGVSFRKEESPIEGLPLPELCSAVAHTEELLMKLVEGTRTTYSEIVAEGELNLETLDTEREFNTLTVFCSFRNIPLKNYEGLSGVRSMLELFQFTIHIRHIQSVCEQYNLKGCLGDPRLHKLNELVSELESESSRASLTPVEATKKMVWVKKTLCLDEGTSGKCLELFAAIADSAAFYQFVRDKHFVGKKGQAVFHQQYELITAQLQHEEYDETVLNHLYIAFRFIEPFMDTQQSFQALMGKVTQLDATHGLKQLDTVNSNILLIRLWFSRAEGDTLENVANELDRIISSGHYIFRLSSDDSGSTGAEILLEYTPASSSHVPTSHLSTSPQPPSSLEEAQGPGMAMAMQSLHPYSRVLTRLESRHPEGGGRNLERWNSEQINDFVRKLGFLDTEKAGGEKIKHFLHINEVAYKLLELYVKLRELGHPKYLDLTVTESLPCEILQTAADERVHETEMMLSSWAQRVTQLREQYDWLLFFSVPKLLSVYKVLSQQHVSVDALVQELSFLCPNKESARERIREEIEKCLPSCRKSIGSEAPMHVVGQFLNTLFSTQALPRRSDEGLPRPRSVSYLSLSSSDSMQLLHHCPNYSQAMLIRLIISIYGGVPEPFEVFHCRPGTTEEELNLFLRRAARHPLQCLFLEVNKLPFKLQEFLMQVHLSIQQGAREGREGHALHLPRTPVIHFVETASSILREMPWVQLREHKESGPSLRFEEARKICIKKVIHPNDLSVQLVFGRAGDGKTHYIKQQLRQSRGRLTVAVNEAFTPLSAINTLRTLPPTQRDCAIFFNFTLLPPKDSVVESEHKRYQSLMEVIGWFFFDLLLLGYVEDPDTGRSFRLPGGLGWLVFVEVPSRDLSMAPAEALRHFQEEVPALGLVGAPHAILPETPYAVDPEVQLVCKYLKAYQTVGNNREGIDRLYRETFREGPRLVKFSTDPDLPPSECQKLLRKNMPEHIRNTKITQRLFVKYMRRRCAFLDTLPAFNYNSGLGEYIQNEQGRKVTTDTKRLGSTLMGTMLKEVSDFCDPAIKENWSLKAHQQLLYDFKDEGASLGLISLHPEQLPEHDKTRFTKIGVTIPTMTDLYSRRLLDGYLSRALNVELENGKLTPIDDYAYVLTLDYTIKMLNINERYACGVPVIIEGETGVGKTALVEMLSRLWNHSLLVHWKRQRSRLLGFIRRQMGELSVDASENYEACVRAVGAMSGGQRVREDDLVLLGQLPDANTTSGRFFSVLLSHLRPMRNDPVVSLLCLQEGKHKGASLENLFDHAEEEESPEATASLLHGVLTAQLKPSFHKVNIHAAMTPSDIWKHLQPVFSQAQALREAYTRRRGDSPTVRIPFVTVFLDEVNTSSCLGLFKEIIVDRTFDGEPIPDNVFIVAACNPHRGNSLASHGQKETWVRGSYYVRRLHPTLRFLMWDYGALDESQERDYINAKMRMLDRQMPNVEVASLTDLIVTSQNLMRQYAFQQLRWLGKEEARRSSKSCVSQRDIQRVFTFYQWLMATYQLNQPFGERADYSRRAVLVALGIVYYMRLNNKFRKDYEEFIDREGRLPNEVSFSSAFSQELDWYMNQVELPAGIARTQALKENLFATIICTVTHNPLIIVGAPGSSKTLSFNLTIANLKGQESKVKLFRETFLFHSLDPHFYQCSRRTTSNEIQTVFSRAINRQRSHARFKLPIYCVVFMDEAGLPEESHESLKVLHYHLDRQEVSFVAITNHVLDAAKTNRAVSLFRPEATDEDLRILAKGCLCSTPDNPPPDLERDLKMIVDFCLPYSHLMTRPESQHFFGLRDFIHFVNYLRRSSRGKLLTDQLVVEALERNFNGSDDFEKIAKSFLTTMGSSLEAVQRRSILEILCDSLEDRPQQGARDIMENEVRYKLIIDPSEDDSLIRLLFAFNIVDRKRTKMFVCSDFPGDSQLQKINTIAAIRHSAIEGHTVIMSQTDDIHESFYDLFNQRFRRIDDPQQGPRFYTNIAIGAHLKPSRVHPDFQCVVVVKKSEIKHTPAPFLNRFEKYCISHSSLLETALAQLPPCMGVLIHSTMEKVQQFVTCVGGTASLYGLKVETLHSLVLSLLPPPTHSYQSLGEPSLVDSDANIRIFFMLELLKALRYSAGFCIPMYTMDELTLDTDQLFSLVLTDPEFEGLMASLTHTQAMVAVTEAMSVLHSAPGPREGEEEGGARVELSAEGSLAVALLQQWLVRHLCKRLMQLMTPEALVLHREKIPSSYLANYLAFHTHFSLKELVGKYSSALETLEFTEQKNPTKLLCFTRSSPFIHQLPAQFPSAVFGTQDSLSVHYTLQSQVFPDPRRLMVYKLSSLPSQSGVQELLREFVRSDSTHILLLVANMQEASREMVNHIRIMVEEAESQTTHRNKLFLLLLHFPPAKFFDACYPSLFLQGWDHCYLDTIAHSAQPGMVDIHDWFRQCCFPLDTAPSSEQDSLIQALQGMLNEAIPVLSSRVVFGAQREGSFNRIMSGSERSKVLKELLFEKRVGHVLCERFRSYWKPAVMAEYLERAAVFTKNRKSTLNITDHIQTVFKGLFFDFLVYLVSRINEDFNLDILFDKDCSPPVQELFLSLLCVFPLPRLAQLKVLSSNPPSAVRPQDHVPQFPFFRMVCEGVERLVEQGWEEANKQLDILQEEAESLPHSQSNMFGALQSIVEKRLEEITQTTPEGSLSVAVRAMGTYPELWTRYFSDFTQHKLHLDSRGGRISQKLLHAFFGQMHSLEALSRLVSLHVYLRVYQLDLAKMAAVLRPLDRVQELGRGSPHLLSPQVPTSPSRQLLSSVQQTHHPLGSSEQLSAFVISTLFAAIVGAAYSDKPVQERLEKMSAWYKAYRDVLVLPPLKQYIYVALGGSEEAEAKLNVMQASFLAVQSKDRPDEDLLLKAQQIFTTLFTRHFSEEHQLRSQCPRLAEVTSVAVELLTDTSFTPSLHRDNQKVRLLMEGLFAHFFHPHRQQYHSDDCRWFLELANEQEQWRGDLLEQSVVSSTLSQDIITELEKSLRQHPHTAEVPQGAISMCVFKLYLGRMLGSCDQRSENASLSGPLLLYQHQVRSQVGVVLMATPDLGEPAPYIPTFYRDCPPIQPGPNSQNQRMQQPLAHLYFLTVLEHLHSSELRLSALIRSAATITQLCESLPTPDPEKALLHIELQAVVQVTTQQLALHFDPNQPIQLGEVKAILPELNSLLDEEGTGGGSMGGHGMVLALHLLKLLKSSRRFSELLTRKFDALCRDINCLKPLHERLKTPPEPKPHLFPFMLPGGGEESELSNLYLLVSKTMVAIHQGKAEPEEMVRLGDECVHAVHITSPLEASSSPLDKRLGFRMMVWLVAYYEFFDKQVSSDLLCNVVGGQLAPYLMEEGYIRLIQAFLNPGLMVHRPEAPNPLREDEQVLELAPGGGHRPLQRSGVPLADPLYLLFFPDNPQQQDQSDVDLRHSLANLVGVVLGCPSHSNHLWYHLFAADQLKDSYMTGFMYDAKISPEGLLYDCGVELSPDGQFGRQDYLKHASRGTYTLHSLYLLLWANFGAFCMSLLTQPDSDTKIHGPVISDWLSVRHYCVSQLRTVWMHMRNNLGISDEERAFFVTRCVKRFYELQSSALAVPDCQRGVFHTRQELDGYERLWHSCVYQPCWSELRTKFAEYSQLWPHKLFMELRRLEGQYPHFPSEKDFTHSVLSSGDLRQQAEGGDLRLLSQFVLEWPRLQAGGLLLPDLVEFYQWLHTALAHIVTYERATSLPIGRVVHLAAMRYPREMGDHIVALYERLKGGYNQYVEMIGGAIGVGACAALRRGNKIYTIADNIPLLHFLSDVVEEEEGNDWLYTVIADIVQAHNSFLDGLYSSVQAQQQASLARLLADEPTKVYPTEVNECNCLVGRFRSLHGLNEFLQLIRSRYQPPSMDSPTFSATHPKMSISHTLLQTSRKPAFQLAQLQEDVITTFLAGKPLITSLGPTLRTLFKFRETLLHAKAHGPHMAGSSLDLSAIKEKLPDQFKMPLSEIMLKRLEYDFHSASYHTLMEVVTGLGNAAGHLIKSLLDQPEGGLLELQLLQQFLMALYDQLGQGSKALEEIGIHSASLTTTQMACLLELPLPSLLSALQLFTRWVEEGFYDFCHLPFAMKSKLLDQDLSTLQEIPQRWTGSQGELLEEVRQMNEVLLHSETHITKIVGNSEAAQKPIVEFLHEIQMFGEDDRLPQFIPKTICLQHFVAFCLALRRLVVYIQQQQLEEEGEGPQEHWHELVGDLWEWWLPHLREWGYGYGESPFMFDPETGRYGFQELSDGESEGGLMEDLMGEEEGVSLPEEEESESESGEEEEDTQDDLEQLLRKNPELKKQVLSVAMTLQKDSDTLEERARGYSVENVVTFLTETGLGRYVEAFREAEISGEVLLEADEEMLRELGVESALDRLRIPLLFKRRLHRTRVRYPVSRVAEFLQQHSLGRYEESFRRHRVDGEVLMEASDHVLKELGVGSAIDRVKIRTKFKTFVKSS